MLVFLLPNVPPVIGRGLRFTPWVPDRFPVCEVPVTYDTVWMCFLWKCRSDQHRSQSPMQFQQHYMGFGINHYYRHSNEQFANRLAYRAPSRVGYSPWFVLSLFADTWAVLQGPLSHPDWVRGSDTTAGGLSASGSSQNGAPVFPILIQ